MKEVIETKTIENELIVTKEELNKIEEITKIKIANLEDTKLVLENKLDRTEKELECIEEYKQEVKDLNEKV